MARIGCSEELARLVEMNGEISAKDQRGWGSASVIFLKIGGKLLEERMGEVVGSPFLQMSRTVEMWH